MFSKPCLSAALVAAALVSQPAGAGEGRYGFRCTIIEAVTTHYAAGSGFPDLTNHLPTNTRTFIIDVDKKTYSERFLGSDGPAVPFTIEQFPQFGASLELDRAHDTGIWLTGRFAGAYVGNWVEKDRDVYAPAVESITHRPEGHCEEVTDIPDIDLPAKSFADRAKKSLSGMVGVK